MIWDSKIIQPCGYAYVETIRGRRDGSMIYSVEPYQIKKQTFGRSTQGKTTRNLFFQIDQPVTVCDNLTLIPTKEGFFLANSTNRYSKTLPKSEKDFATLEKLLIADSDYGRYEGHLRIEEADGRSSIMQCLNANTMVHQMPHEDGSLGHIIDADDQLLILYYQNGNVYVPKCTTIKQMYVMA